MAFENCPWGTETPITNSCELELKVREPDQVHVTRWKQYSCLAVCLRCSSSEHYTRFTGTHTRYGLFLIGTERRYSSIYCSVTP